MGKRRRRAGAAEADEGDDKGEASAVQTTMRLMGEDVEVRHIAPVGVTYSPFCSEHRALIMFYVRG